MTARWIYIHHSWPSLHWHTENRVLQWLKPRWLNCRVKKVGEHAGGVVFISSTPSPNNQKSFWSALENSVGRVDLVSVTVAVLTLLWLSQTSRYVVCGQLILIVNCDQFWSSKIVNHGGVSRNNFLCCCDHIVVLFLAFFIIENKKMMVNEITQMLPKVTRCFVEIRELYICAQTHAWYSGVWS